MFDRLCGSIGAAFRWALIGMLSAVVVGCATTVLRPPLRRRPITTTLSGRVIRSISWFGEILSFSMSFRFVLMEKLTPPLVEDLVAMGKDSTTLADIEKELGKFIRDSVVTVVVTAFVGPPWRANPRGRRSSKPQTLPYKQKMTLLDVHDCGRWYDRLC